MVMDLLKVNDHELNENDYLRKYRGFCPDSTDAYIMARYQCMKNPSKENWDKATEEWKKTVYAHPKQTLLFS